MRRSRDQREPEPVREECPPAHEKVLFRVDAKLTTAEPRPSSRVSGHRPQVAQLPPSALLRVPGSHDQAEQFRQAFQIAKESQHLPPNLFRLAGDHVTSLPEPGK